MSNDAVVGLNADYLARLKRQADRVLLEYNTLNINPFADLSEEEGGDPPNNQKMLKAVKKGKVVELLVPKGRLKSSFFKGSKNDATWGAGGLRPEPRWRFWGGP